MTFRQALDIVYQLAEQNMRTDEYGDEAKAEQERQKEALEIVLNKLRELKLQGE